MLSFKELLSKDNRKGLVVITFLEFFSGNNVIQDYSQTIFSKIESNLQPEEISIILAVVSRASVFVGNVTVDRWGRKPLLLISVTGCTICNTIIAMYFFLSEREGADVTAYGWIPISALMTFKVMHGIGLGMMIFVMMGENFPKHLKSVAGVLWVFVSAIAESISSKSFQTISDNLPIFGNSVYYLACS